MTNINEKIANLPAVVRHCLGIFIGAMFTAIAAAIVAAGGVTGVDWVPALWEALDAAVVAAIAGTGVLAATPLTDAYGVGKGETYVNTDEDLAAQLEAENDIEISEEELDVLLQEDVEDSEEPV